MTSLKLLRLPILSLALVLPLTGCGDDDSSGSAPPPPPPPSTAPAAKPLDLATVQSLTAPRFQKDPNCGHGQWSDNSTGIDEEFRGAAKTIQQFDCYLSKDDVGGLPKRGQQSIYVEFDDPATAKSFAQDQSTLYATLVDGPRVVVAGAGLDTVDMEAYLADLQNSCSCGELIAPGG